MLLQCKRIARRKFVQLGIGYACYNGKQATGSSIVRRKTSFKKDSIFAQLAKERSRIQRISAHCALVHAERFAQNQDDIRPAFERITARHDLSSITEFVSSR